MHMSLHTLCVNELHTHARTHTRTHTHCAFCKHCKRKVKLTRQDAVSHPGVPSMEVPHTHYIVTMVSIPSHILCASEALQSGCPDHQRPVGPPG